MQIIGVYFVGELEENLVGNFTKSIKGHVNLLTYSIGEEMEKERGEEDPTSKKRLMRYLKTGIIHRMIFRKYKSSTPAADA